MKQCPKCGNSYTDDTLRFCLEDGTELAPADEQPTVVRAAHHDPNITEELPAAATQAVRDPLRVDIAPTTLPTVSPTLPRKSGSSTLLKVLIAIVALGLLVVLGASVLGIAFYFGSKRNVAGSETPTPTPWTTPSFSPTPDDEKEKLEQEIANLQKLLDDRSNANTNLANLFDTSRMVGTPATVNSPGDGFLALRSLPHPDFGERKAKIPHGSAVRIIRCSETIQVVGGRSGLWCFVKYQDQFGWAFDAWLDRGKAAN